MAFMKKDNRKAWEKEQRRNRIIDIAKELMFENGYDNVKVEDIADAADYTKRTIYLYFKDKEEIFLAVVLKGQKLFIERLKEAAQKKPSISNPKANDMILNRLGRAFYDFSIEYPGYFSMIMAYESTFHIYHHTPRETAGLTFRQQCQNASDDYGAIVTRAIEEDIINGRIKTHLTPVQLMLILWGQIFGVMKVLLMRQDRFNETYGINQDDLFNTFMAMVKKGLE